MPVEEEVRKEFTTLLVEEEGENMRARAQGLRKLTKIVVEKDGSSYANLKCLVD